jgi:(p)ppGpp synthase/HD superfamily hydrolase
MAPRTLKDTKTSPSVHLGDRFVQAIDYARHLHIETRKGSGIPVMAHLLGVTSLVLGEAGHVDFRVTENIAIAALLHDAVEDHGGTLRLKDIEYNFGAAVARMVEGLSDTFADNADDKEPWEVRKRAYIARLKREAPDVQLISAADKLYNARTILDDYRQIGPEVWTRFKRGRDQQLWYFRALLDVFEQSPTNRIVEELKRVVDELARISADESKPAPDHGQARPLRPRKA